MMRALFSIVFVVFLLLPAGAWVTGLDFGIDTERLGLERPQIDSRALLDSEYYLSFDQYFNDSFSLRGSLIFAKNWVDYNVFRTTDSPHIHIGLEGWLYSHTSIVDYRKDAGDDLGAADQLALGLHALEKVIEASGRRFLFTVAPNKATVYPEFVGFVPKRGDCDRSFYDLFLDSLTTVPLPGFTRLDELLRAEKEGRDLLYEKTGTHWNERGARVVAKRILEKIFGGSAELLLAQLVSDRNLTPEELARMKTILESLEEDQS